MLSDFQNHFFSNLLTRAISLETSKRSAFELACKKVNRVYVTVSTSAATLLCATSLVTSSSKFSHRALSKDISEDIAEDIAKKED